MPPPTIARRAAAAQSNTFKNKRGELCEVIHKDHARSLEIIYKPEKKTYLAEYAFHKRIDGQQKEFKTKISITSWIGNKQTPTWTLSHQQVITLVTQGWLDLEKPDSHGGVKRTRYALNSLTLVKEVINNPGESRPGQCLKWVPAILWEEKVKVGQRGARVEVVINYKLVTTTGVHFIVPNTMPVFTYTNADGRNFDIRLSLGLAGFTAICNAAGTFLKDAVAGVAIPADKQKGFGLAYLDFEIDREAAGDAVRIKAESDDEAERLYNESCLLPAGTPPAERYKARNAFTSKAKPARITYRVWKTPVEGEAVEGEADALWGKSNGINSIDKEMDLPFEFVPPSGRFAKYVYEGGVTTLAKKSEGVAAAKSGWDDEDLDDFDSPATPTPPRQSFPSPLPKHAAPEEDDEPPMF